MKGGDKMKDKEYIKIFEHALEELEEKLNVPWYEIIEVMSEVLEEKIAIYLNITPKQVEKMEIYQEWFYERAQDV